MSKLKSKKGASIFIALLFFLVCAVVGVLILSGATANAGRVVRERAEMEQYLAVSSAAQLLRDEIAEIKIVVVHTRTDVLTTPPGSRVIGSMSPPDFSGSSGGNLLDLVRGMAEAIYKEAIEPNGTPADQTTTLTIDAGSQYEVTAELTMNKTDYSIVAVLYIVVNGVETNAMTLTCNSGSPLIPAKDELFVQDMSKDVTHGSYTDEDGEIISIDYIPMIYEISATWPVDKCIITKGGGE